MSVNSNVKKLIKSYQDEIQAGSFEDLFVDAHLKGFATRYIRELHEILLTADVFDSTELRSRLLFEEIEIHLKIAKKNQDDPTMKDKFLVQFIRGYLGSCFGFELEEVIQFMVENQEQLDVGLEPYNIRGQAGISNYILLFD